LLLLYPSLFIFLSIWTAYRQQTSALLWQHTDNKLQHPFQQFRCKSSSNLRILACVWCVSSKHTIQLMCVVHKTSLVKPAFSTTATASKLVTLWVFNMKLPYQNPCEIGISSGGKRFRSRASGLNTARGSGFLSVKFDFNWISDISGPWPLPNWQMPIEMSLNYYKASHQISSFKNTYVYIMLQPQGTLFCRHHKDLYIILQGASITLHIILMGGTIHMTHTSESRTWLDSQGAKKLASKLNSDNYAAKLVHIRRALYSSTTIAHPHQKVGSGQVCNLSDRRCIRLFVWRRKALY